MIPKVYQKVIEFLTSKDRINSNNFQTETLKLAKRLGQTLNPFGHIRQHSTEGDGLMAETVRIISNKNFASFGSSIGQNDKKNEVIKESFYYINLILNLTYTYNPSSTPWG